MTPADEAEFIVLWQQGLETAAIAARLGIKATTAQSRAHRLQQRELIQPRPRGENYPTERARERQPLALSEATETPPVHTPLDPLPGSPDLSGVLNTLVERLSAIEETLRHGGVQRSTPVQDYAPVQVYAPV